MIHTCRFPFIRDCGNAQAGFREFCRVICRDEARLTVLSDPVFSYGRSGRELLAPVRDAVRRGDITIAYLCDIPAYATVLVSTPDAEPTHLTDIIDRYPSLDALEQTPAIIAYYPIADGWRRAAIDDTTILIGVIPDSLVDDETGKPDPCAVLVLDECPTPEGSVFAWRPLESARCFGAIWGATSYPTYFLNGSLGGDVWVRQCLAQYAADGLTEYLKTLRVPFGTLYDCHQDDAFAVSYRGDIWNGPNEYLAFLA